MCECQGEKAVFSLKPAYKNVLLMSDQEVCYSNFLPHKAKQLFQRTRRQFYLREGRNSERRHALWAFITSLYLAPGSTTTHSLAGLHSSYLYFSYFAIKKSACSGEFYFCFGHCWMFLKCKQVFCFTKETRSI